MKISPYYLNPDQIEHNKKQYIDIFSSILSRYPGSDKLLDWICSTDFFEAPASAQGHLCCVGGLCQHSLNVYRQLVQLCNNNGVDLSSLDTDEHGLVLIALCHDLCKCNTYKQDFKNVKVYKVDGTKRDNNGAFDWESQIYYKYEPELPGFGHGGKSLFIVQNFIKDMPISEATAIRHHMGGHEYPGVVEPGVSLVYNECTLAFYLHIADMFATFVDERY